MGTLGSTTMASTPSFAVLLTIIVVLAAISESQAYNVDRNPFTVERRGYRDPDDPRNLFAAMYGANYKRSGPTNNMLADYDHQLGALPHKRGLRDRDDPRNLFRSVYGGIFRR